MKTELIASLLCSCGMAVLDALTGIYMLVSDDVSGGDDMTFALVTAAVTIVLIGTCAPLVGMPWRSIQLALFKTEEHSSVDVMRKQLLKVPYSSIPLHVFFSS